MKQQVEKLLQGAVRKLGVDIPVVVEMPKEVVHGDYTTNVALVLSKKLDRSPREVAQEIASTIGPHTFLEKIEVAGPGFINFHLSKEFFISELQKIDTNIGKKKKPFFGAKKVMVEYTDPNPFKKFHIGHLSSNAKGEALSRILEFQGMQVKRANYQGDVGMHVAKAVWALKQGTSLEQAYAAGDKAFRESELAKQEITEINKKIYEKSDQSINKLYIEGRRSSLESFEQVYKKLGTKFDYYFFESEVSDFGKKTVENGLRKNIFEKGENGAIIFNGEKFGLHTRVFINSEGLPTYEAKELGLAQLKYQKYPYDQSIVITGNEINEYFKVLLCALAKLFPRLEKKTKHIGHGMLRLPEGKMSSRTGNIVAAEDFITKTKEMVSEKAKDKNVSDEDIEKIAIGAIKYSILKQGIGSDIVFDFEKSISFEGDSGPYLQYSLVRANSVLKKAKSDTNPMPTGRQARMTFKSTNVPIGQLEKMLVRFPEIVEKAAENYEPHYITLYLTGLAREFNNYYAKNVIVDKSQESPYRVALTQAFAQVMRNGLWLLGIPEPTKM